MSRTRTTEPLGEAPEPLTEPLEVSAARLVMGRYRLDRRLGAGGFGVVWQAHDERLERDVAVKVIPRAAGDPSTRGAQAEREARVAARLNHPAIVALYELGGDAQATYLVSELVRGHTFAELHREGALSDRDVARIGATVAGGLVHAHERGVIHRDVKPQNVIVVAQPAAGEGFAKLTDFGVARLAGGEPQTRTGDVVGTLAYMAPEQAEGERVGPEADVYSLALTLYEGWTGANPLRATTPAATARRIGTRLPALRSRRRDLPAGLGHWIDLALDPDPARRPPLEGLREALEQAAGGLSDAGGLVEPATRARFRRLDRPEAAGRPGLGDSRLAAAGRVLAGVPTRIAAGLAAGGLVLAALGALPEAPPLRPALAAAGAAAAVALLPRIGWLVTAAALLAWLAAPEVGLPGTAVVALLAVAAVPLALPRAGPLWSLPALAPLLGTVGLAGAFPAIAALAPTAPRRAGLAAAGLVALAAAELLTGEAMLLGAPADVPPATGWDGSAREAATEAVAPLVSSGGLLVAPLWALLALALPLAVRGRSLVLDAARGLVWIVAAVSAHAALGEAIGGALGRTEPRGILLGATVGVVAALAAAAVAAGRAGPERALDDDLVP